MLLPNNKVADDRTSAHSFQESQAMLDSLMKVVACYRHLASCMGSSTDCARLRYKLQQTCKCGQTLLQFCHDHLTARLRDRSLPNQERREAELQWVVFSSCLELFHTDMCKVYHMGHSFSMTNSSSRVQTGMQGGMAKVAARALILPEMQAVASMQASSTEDLEQTQLEEEMARVYCTLQDMELKVNVLPWTVEASGPLYASLSSGSSSLSLLSIDEEAPGGLCTCHGCLPVMLLLCCGATVAVVLSVSMVLLA
ncbi:regulator of G-protein signaling 9-binding protein [Brachyhypopomus gauderio]|uniref:regulator of G-protein signaling 9-binding protein n=1 Tax=Brachyhypopomus gauderio TaxID=698409 RepID=UPI004041ED7B